MSRFRKKPVVIEAVQFDGTVSSEDAICQWAGAEVRDDGTSRQRIQRANQFGPLLIHTLAGDVLAQKGDWIIRGVKGEFYPVKPDIFEATYEPADRPGVPPAPDALREAALRRLLWLRHGCGIHALYGDDGEMQCSTCCIDFKRDPVEEIEERWRSAGERAVRAALAAAPEGETP